MAITQAFGRAAHVVAVSAALALACGLTGCSGLGQARRAAEAQLVNAQELAIQAQAVSQAARACAAELAQLRVDTARQRVASSLIDVRIENNPQAVREQVDHFRSVTDEAGWSGRAAQQLARRHPAIYDAAILSQDAGVQRVLSDARQLDQLNRALAASQSSDRTEQLEAQRRQLLNSYAHVHHVQQQSTQALGEIDQLTQSLSEHVEVALVYAQAFVDLTRTEHATRSLWTDPQLRRVMLEQVDESMGSEARDRAERISTVIDALIGAQADLAGPINEDAP